MKKNSVLRGACIAVLLAAAETAAAQNLPDVFAFPLNRESAAAFDAVCAEFGAYAYLKGDFRQTKTGAKGRSLVSRGEILVSREQGIVIRTLSPVFLQFFAGEDFVVQTNSAGKKTRLEAGGNESFLETARMLKAVFSGDADFLKQNCEIFYKKEGPSWLIGIKPGADSPASFFSSITLRGGRSLEMILFKAENGDTIRYDLSNIRNPGALSEDEKAYFL